MTEKELLSILETLKEFRNILLGHEIQFLTDHKNLNYETIYSASQCVQLWKILIQESGVTLLYIKVEANVVVDYCIQLTMVHHAHKLVDTPLEEDTCEILCLDQLFVSYNTDCFSPGKEEISLPLAPQIVEAEQNL